MPFFRVVAAKNNQKVELTAKFDSEIIARESLHKQGYSIIEIRETETPKDAAPKTGSVFYFEIELHGQKKTWQIHSDDIFKAYKKLVDDLWYTVTSIYATQDATEEEKIYTTAKTRESYEEFKKRNAGVDTPEIKEQAKKSTDEDEQDSFLAKEVKKYQAVIGAVYTKLETLLNTYAHQLEAERVSKIKELLPLLRQMRQATNIDKLRIVWEASLVKIGELEMDILAKNKEIERAQFLKETNSLLRELGSSKRVWNDFSSIKKKLLGFFWDLSSSGEAEVKAVESTEKKIDTSSFVYYKNLRELSLYKERLSLVKKEILKALFKGAQKRKRLLLKKRLIEQNIQIIESRITKKRFSYTKIAKWVLYYEEVFVYLLRAISDIVLYALSLFILIFSATSFFWPPVSERLVQIAFFGAILGVFSVIFHRARSFMGVSMGFGVFLLVSFALRINF